MKALLLSLAVWAPLACAAEPVTLCLSNPEAVSADLKDQWHKELRAILEASHYELALAACGRGAIELRVLAVSPHEPTALGAARTAGHRIEPKLEVYLSPLGEMIGTRLAGPLGRAMARVTAHELRHLLSQKTEHDRHMFRDTYSAGLLLAAKPSYFRLR